MMARFVLPDSAFWLAALVGSGLLVAAFLLRADGRSPFDGRLRGSTLVLVAATAALSGCSYFAQFMTPFTFAWSAAWILYAALATASAAGLPRATSLRWLVVASFAVLHAGLVALTVLTSDPVIDVHVFLSHGAEALLQGQNPYSVTYPNIYGPEETSLYYGPGVVERGQVTYGAPYPPFSLLWAVPGYVLGDVRLASLAATMVLAALMYGRGRESRGVALSILLVTLPTTGHVIGGSWTESSIAALLGGAVWAVTRRRFMVAAVLLGLLFASKQYMVVALPCLWLLRPYATKARVAVFTGVAAASVVPFLLWNPGDFWRAIVEFQLIQPFRPDSLSLLVWLVNHGWTSGRSASGVLPLAVGAAIAVAVAWRAKPGATSFAAALGLSLLGTVLLSKQAFVNYYYLVGVAWLIASWASHQQEPHRGPEGATHENGDIVTDASASTAIPVA